MDKKRKINYLLVDDKGKVYETSRTKSYLILNIGILSRRYREKLKIIKKI